MRDVSCDATRGAGTHTLLILLSTFCCVVLLSFVPCNRRGSAQKLAIWPLATTHNFVPRRAQNATNLGLVIKNTKANPVTKTTIRSELSAFASMLPERVWRAIEHGHEGSQLVEVMMNLGQPSLTRFRTSDGIVMPDAQCEIDPPVTADELEAALRSDALTTWTCDERAGIKGTLHRVSRNINPHTGETIGLCIRVGYPKIGAARRIDDLLRSGRSILILGAPGVGKTTVLREASRVMSDEYQKRTVVIDTSNEIAGGANVPHWSVGRLTTRVMVKSRDDQHNVMLRAVCNLNPQVVIIDEIGSKEDANAAASIAARGVMLIGTCHGNTLQDLLNNPEVNLLTGGVKDVIIGDLGAKLYSDGRKIRLSRVSEPVFNTLIELGSTPDLWKVHEDLRKSVDLALTGRTPESRGRNDPDLAQAAAGQDTSSLNPIFGRNATQASAASIPIRSKVSDEACGFAENGQAYLLTFDGGVTQHGKSSSTSWISGAGAVLSRIRAGPISATSVEFSCIPADQRRWQYFLDGESTPEQIEYGGLILGLQGVVDSWPSLKPTPQALLVQGDCKFVIQHLKAALEANETHTTLLGRIQHFKAALSGLMFDTLEFRMLRMKVLTLLEKIPSHVELLWLPREFNKAADAVAQDARDQRRSDYQFSPYLLQALLAPRSRKFSLSNVKDDSASEIVAKMVAEPNINPWRGAVAISGMLDASSNTASGAARFIPIRSQVSKVSCDIAERGGAFLLKFWGGITQVSPSHGWRNETAKGAAAVLSRIRAGHISATSTEFSCIYDHQQRWQHFRGKNVTREEIEYGALARGLQGVVDSWTSLRPTPKALLVQGDCRFVIEHLKAARIPHLTDAGFAIASGSLWDKQELTMLRTKVLALLDKIPARIEFLLLHNVVAQGEGAESENGKRKAGSGNVESGKRKWGKRK